MRVEFDRDTCIGMFNCVGEWEKFVEDTDAGKATLVDGVERYLDLYVREVPEGEETRAKMAARVCPVDAISVFDGDEQVVP